VLLIAIVGAAFSYVSANPVEIVEPWLGITGTMVQNEGFLITCVEPDSPAENADLEINDIITEVDNIRVTRLEEIAGVLEQKQIGDSISFRILRGADQTRTESLTLIDKPDAVTCQP
jgi:putative serine protease PepD